MIPIGHACHPTDLTASADLHHLDPSSLTRHAVCLGATGSGKTGMCLGLLESLAVAGVPILAIDPKGDLANLALVFDRLDAERLTGWVPDPVATAAAWQGAPDRRSDAERGAWRGTVEVRVLTPGSEAGVPVDVLSALARAPAGLAGDVEGLREYVIGAVGALLGLIGRAADPMTDPSAILLARLLGDAFAAGRSMPLDALIPAVVDPPFDHVGLFPLETFLPHDDRLELARSLNAVVSSPAFEPWRRGVPLDVGAWLTPGERTPVHVVYLSHLDDGQRMFFVTLLLHAVVAWSRRLPGASRLRALLYFDEVMGYLPPHPRSPPSKAPVLTLLKQARGVGVGVMLCTQNPVDMDYKAMSNAGTWLLGRLATRQDRARVVDGMDAGEEVSQRIAQLPPRTFLLREEQRLSVVRSRQTLALLRGPLTRREVGLLGQGWTSGATARVPAPPPLPRSLPARWLSEEGRVAVFGDKGAEDPVYRPAVYARFRVRFGDRHLRVVHRLWWDGKVAHTVIEDGWLLKEGRPGRYEGAPAELHDDAAVARWKLRWEAEIAATEVWERDGHAVAARRHEVETAGVVVIWVG
jgi:hypothetical protein